MQRSDFAYELPRALIAQAPLPQRDRSRLLHLGGDGVGHRQFSDLPGLLRPGDLLVVNDTRVINARLLGVKDSGGAVELLVERIESDRLALCQARSSKPLRPGRTVNVAGWRLGVIERQGEFHRLEFPVGVATFLDRFGETPLPPYIDRAPERCDSQRYQTIYAARPGAVAAPTAGLHFSEDVFDRLTDIGVQVAAITLHVGAGTFQPVRTEELDRHRLHAERYELPADTAMSIRACGEGGGRVVAVGTTVVRALETAAASGGGVDAGFGETDLFITPGYRFKAVDALLTNFHLPESTLLMLVCAFAGYRRVMSAYAEAVKAQYRFFSYGDAMFCERGEDV